MPLRDRRRALLRGPRRRACVAGAQRGVRRRRGRDGRGATTCPGAFELPLAALYLARDRPLRGRRLPRRGDPRRDRPLRLRLHRGRARDPGRAAAHRRAVRVRRADRRVDGAGAGARRRRQARHRLRTRPRPCCAWPRCGRSWREVRRHRPHLRRAPAAPTRGSRRRSGRRSATPARSSTSAPATGNYEPPDREVTAVEPSAVMIAQRPPDAAPACRRRPRRCRSATTASTPRWRCSRSTTGPTGARGIEELRRVARRRRRALVGPELRAPRCGSAPSTSRSSSTRTSRASRASPTRRGALRATRVAAGPGPARLPRRLLRRLLAPARRPTSTPRCARASRRWRAPAGELAPGLERAARGPRHRRLGRAPRRPARRSTSSTSATASSSAAKALRARRSAAARPRPARRAGGWSRRE